MAKKLMGGLMALLITLGIANGEAGKDPVPPVLSRGALVMTFDDSSTAQSRCRA